MTAAQINNEAKIRLQKELVARLRRNGLDEARQTWYNILRDQKLSAEIASYDLGAKERQSQLTKVAFPAYNGDDVNAALEAGAHLNNLYAIARGRAHIAKDAAGRYLKGKKGLKIVLIAKI